MQLRPYQQEAIDSVPERGRYLLQLATGLGKTVVFSHLPRRGRMLILAHREELLDQPREYFDCSYGVEQADRVSNGEEVVAASMQTIIKRLDKFRPDEFDIIVLDECHRGACPSYQTILAHFKPRLLLGVTATPMRGDGAGLDKIFDEVIFERSLEWGIQNNYLCGIDCYRVNIGFDLSAVKVKVGDLDSKELAKAINQNVVIKAIAEAYYKHAIGQTIIFVPSVESCNLLNREIPEAVTVIATTKDREKILEYFRDKRIKCLINCMVLTEGVNLPCIETVIFARPTLSQTLYIQAVGRGTRLAQGKGKLKLIDCVGASGKHCLCSAPTLIGIDTDLVPTSTRGDIEGDLFSLPDKIKTLADVPDSWIKNIQQVKLFEKKNKYILHNVNYFKCPDGALILKLPERNWIKILPINKLNHTSIITQDGVIFQNILAQSAFDRVYKKLNNDFKQHEYIWNLARVKAWGKFSISPKQKELIKRIRPDIAVDKLTKLDASQILNRLFLK